MPSLFEDVWLLSSEKKNPRYPICSGGRTTCSLVPRTATVGADLCLLFDDRFHVVQAQVLGLFCILFGEFAVVQWC
ncbi:uncharacterized protein J3R85_004619 [Psidium guajava]|nr:uncharacterized protein J3R85_004619 [Psidium guajava]